MHSSGTAAVGLLSRARLSRMETEAPRSSRASSARLALLPAANISAVLRLGTPGRVGGRP